MSVSPVFREQVYRAYMSFFDTAERTRRWNPLRDVAWDELKPELNTEEDTISLETFCGVELFVPDYTANGFNLTREVFGQAWFQASWGYEESKHALVFREYLIRSGMRTLEQYLDYEREVLDRVWKLPFHTSRQMTVYGAFQEAATYLIYLAQRRKAEASGNNVLESVYRFVARDEAAHMGFYRTVLRFHLEEDREGTLADIGHVLAHFEMPGVGVIPEYARRLGVQGVGITPQEFMEHGIFPTLRAVRTKRTEVFRAYRQRLDQEPAADPDAQAPGSP